MEGRRDGGADRKTLKFPPLDPSVPSSLHLNFSFPSSVQPIVSRAGESTYNRIFNREEFVMLMADTMAIFFVFLGFLLALPGLWLLCRGLWPQTVTNAAAVCQRGLIKPFLAGLPLTAAIIFAAVALGNLGPPGKIGAAAAVCFYLMIANCGVAGLATTIGERLPSRIDAGQAWRATLRGGIALELAYLLPILGWFLILPASVTIGCGASLIALFRNLVARSAAALPQAANSANAISAGTIDFNTLGAKQ
jgi:hypothetical protein